MSIYAKPPSPSAIIVHNMISTVLIFILITAVAAGVGFHQLQKTQTRNALIAGGVACLSALVAVILTPSL